MKTAVVYWSGTGNTEAMAEAVANGAKAAGAEVTSYTADAFNADLAAEYDAVALGCPSMGSEELEDGEFRPMFDAVKGALAGKKVGLFGSYGWGDGEWMRNWQDECGEAGITLVMDGVICNDAPDDDAVANCEALGKALA